MGSTMGFRSFNPRFLWVEASVDPGSWGPWFSPASPVRVNQTVGCLQAMFYQAEGIGLVSVWLFKFLKRKL